MERMAGEDTGGWGGFDQEGLWMPPRRKWESPRGLEDKHTNTVSVGGRPGNTQRCLKSGGNILQSSQSFNIERARHKSDRKRKGAHSQERSVTP